MPMMTWENHYLTRKITIMDITSLWELFITLPPKKNPPIDSSTTTAFTWRLGYPEYVATPAYVRLGARHARYPHCTPAGLGEALGAEFARYTLVRLAGYTRYPRIPVGQMAKRTHCSRTAGTAEVQRRELPPGCTCPHTPPEAGSRRDRHTPQAAECSPLFER